VATPAGNAREGRPHRLARAFKKYSEWWGNGSKGRKRSRKAGKCLERPEKVSKGWKSDSKGWKMSRKAGKMTRKRLEK
jgi:hypothetical protein